MCLRNSLRVEDMPRDVCTPVLEGDAPGALHTRLCATSAQHPDAKGRGRDMSGRAHCRGPPTPPGGRRAALHTRAWPVRGPLWLHAHAPSAGSRGVWELEPRLTWTRTGSRAGRHPPRRAGRPGPRPRGGRAAWCWGGKQTGALPERRDGRVQPQKVPDPLPATQRVRKMYPEQTHGGHLPYYTSALLFN